MFIEDQSGKVLFNMLHYKLKKIDNRIGIFDKKENYLGVICEFKDHHITQIIMDEMVANMKHAAINRIFFKYEIPSEQEISELIKHG